ncbi:ECF transporter S component [Loigolactobacillus iwatensis]|uniref:ECF transporter S component n=1 Tax=Loigolactobacillus iwatensis TaxID=1267156 RepID=UPI000F7EC964|nr:ECF transporter S component [Loigolactobacillus iwatensis]
MQHDHLRLVTQAAMFAAIDYILAMFQFHVPSPVGHPFVDLGFTFVALGTLFLGWRYAMLAGAIGLGLFDLMNGYANHAYLTVLEVVLLVGVVALAFKLMHHQLTSGTIVSLGIIAGLTKMVTGFIRYFIESSVDLGLPPMRASIQALVGMPADILTGILMFFTVPLFFFVLQRVTRQVHWYSWQ